MHENLINDINYLITFFEKYTNNKWLSDYNVFI